MDWWWWWCWWWWWWWWWPWTVWFRYKRFSTWNYCIGSRIISNVSKLIHEYTLITANSSRQYSLIFSDAESSFINIYQDILYWNALWSAPTIAIIIIIIVVIVIVISIIKHHRHPHHYQLMITMIIRSQSIPLPKSNKHKPTFFGVFSSNPILETCSHHLFLTERLQFVHLCNTGVEQQRILPQKLLRRSRWKRWDLRSREICNPQYTLYGNDCYIAIEVMAQSK